VRTERFVLLPFSLTVVYSKDKYLNSSLPSPATVDPE
jgi:hypothetical protein